MIVSYSDMRANLAQNTYAIIIFLELSLDVDQSNSSTTCSPLLCLKYVNLISFCSAYKEETKSYTPTLDTLP